MQGFIYETRPAITAYLWLKIILLENSILLSMIKDTIGIRRKYDIAYYFSLTITVL